MQKCSSHSVGKYIGGEMDNSQVTWRLGDNIDLIEAQFVLGDFCLNHFPDNPQLARSVQSTDSIGSIRTALKPIVNLIVTQHKELTDEFTTLIHEINQTEA